MYMYSRIVNEIVTTYEPQILEKSKFFRQQVKIFVKSSVRGSLACTSVALCRWHRCVFGFDHFWNGGATACERAAANFVVVLQFIHSARSLNVYPHFRNGWTQTRSDVIGIMQRTYKRVISAPTILQKSSLVDEKTSISPEFVARK